MKRFILAIPLPISLCLMGMACFGILALLESVSDRREDKTNNFNQLYSIDPASLLGDIAQGKIDVFIPIDEERPWPDPDQQIPVPWLQEDYLDIANALFEFTWSDTLEGWQLFTVFFNSDCKQYDFGFQSGIFYFFKNVEINGNKFRIERLVNIDPRNKTVSLAENRYSPRLADWTSMPLNQDLLSAEEALQKAENAGGKEKRLSVGNACYISLTFHHDRGWWNNKLWWDVGYSQTDDEGRLTTLLTVDVDPYTGELRP
jgi:hypothetical protein